MMEQEMCDYKGNCTHNNIIYQWPFSCLDISSESRPNDWNRAKCPCGGPQVRRVEQKGHSSRVCESVSVDTKIFTVMRSLHSGLINSRQVPEWG